MGDDIERDHGVTYIGPRAFVAGFVLLCALFGGAIVAAPQIAQTLEHSASGDLPPDGAAPPAAPVTAVAVPHASPIAAISQSTAPPIPHVSTNPAPPAGVIVRGSAATLASSAPIAALRSVALSARRPMVALPGEVSPIRDKTAPVRVGVPRFVPDPSHVRIARVATAAVAGRKVPADPLRSAVARVIAHASSPPLADAAAPTSVQVRGGALLVQFAPSRALTPLSAPPADTASNAALIVKP